jgi:DNA-binding MarR family transcriptional regulator
MINEEARSYVNTYCHLRDIQYAAYDHYARGFGLTAKEFFVMDILYFAPKGCHQSAICERLSTNKQTISAIVKKFKKRGYLSLCKDKGDARNKIIRFSPKGQTWAGKIITPAAVAEVQAMGDLSKEEMRQLIMLTERFSRAMTNRFAEAEKKRK